MARDTFDDNLKRRMDECRDSALDPEMVTPATAGCEELPEYEETLPIVRQLERKRGSTPPYSRNTRKS